MKRVKQLHDQGCFIACVAMLLGLSYQEAFARVYPNRQMPPKGETGIGIGMSIDDSLAVLNKLGIQIQYSGLRKSSSLKKRTSLILLRWRINPLRSHTLLYDGERGIYLDPLYKIPLPHKALDKNLFGIYYVKREK